MRSIDYDFRISKIVNVVGFEKENMDSEFEGDNNSQEESFWVQEKNKVW